MFNVKIAPEGSMVILGFFKKRYFIVESYGLREVGVNELKKED